MVGLGARAGATRTSPRPSCARRPGRPRRSARAAGRARCSAFSSPTFHFALLTNWKTADRPALVPGAQRHPEGGGRLALHLAGVHDEQRPVAALPRGQPVVRHDRDLSLRHVRPPVVRCGRWRPARRRPAPPAAGSARPAPSPSVAGQAEPDRPGLAVDDDARRCPRRPAARGRAGARRAASPPRAPVARPSVTTTSSGRRRGSRQPLDPQHVVRPAAARRPAGCGRRWAASVSRAAAGLHRRGRRQRQLGVRRRGR